MSRRFYDIEDEIDEDDYSRGRKFDKSARRNERKSRERDRYGFDNDNTVEDYEY